MRCIEIEKYTRFALNLVVTGKYYPAKNGKDV